MQSLHQIQTDFSQFLVEKRISRSGLMGLYEPVNYILDLGGKRLRPAVLLMAYALYKPQYKNVMYAALAIEVFHNFSLVHDDIMDDAPLRRGKPTVHEKYDLNTGILSGDVMLVKAYEYLLKLRNEPNFIDVLEVFTMTCTEVCEGQQMDMDFETDPNVSLDSYLKMIELKTSVLVAGAMKMGALLADAPAEEADLLYGFGRDLGIAFQIQDDILDTFGDPEKFGKRVGGDIIQNKKTFLFLKAMEIAPSSLHVKLKELYASQEMKDEEKVDAVKNIFNQLNIRKLSDAAKAGYENKAMEQLESLVGKGRNIETIKGFAQMLMAREQ